MATVKPTEPPLQRLHRRLGDPALKPGETASQTADGTADGTADETADETVDEAAAGDPEHDPNMLVPRWLPGGSDKDGWLARIRADPGRSGAIALAVIAAVAVLVTVFTVVRDRPAPVTSANIPPVQMASSASAGPEPGGPVVVSVVGLVHRPGLVTLAPGARIADALKAAGDPVDGADTLGLNLARQVVDGEQIVVGIASPPGQPAVLGSSVSPGSAPSGTPATGTSPAAKPGQPIDLNTATAQQLDTLPGVGPVTAAAIVAWRDAHGRFGSVDQLADVDGIGPARLEKLRALVRV